MFIWIGAATCLYAAFAVGHSGFGVIIVFIFSNNQNGVQAFTLAGQWGSVLQLVLSLMIMGMSMTNSTGYAPGPTSPY